MLRLAGILLLAGCWYEYGFTVKTEATGIGDEPDEPWDEPELDTSDTAPREDPEVVALVPGERETISLSFTLEGSLDLAFLIDTTRSMDSLIDAVVVEFASIADQVGEDNAGMRWGYATFDDYGQPPYGNPGVDIPFALRLAQTDDLDAMQAALAATVIHDGEDAPEASMEALWQGVSGAGYDLDCDGVYDPGYDILPYVASADDPFGGLAGSAGAEGSGGFGFAAGRVPVLVYATNYEMRDADDTRYTTPGGCPADAGMDDVVAGMTAIGAKAIGVAVNLHEGSYAVGQMQALAQRTQSLADLDGDGFVEPAVLTWSDSSTVFRETLVNAVGQLQQAMRWDLVWLEYDDPWGLILDVSPDRQPDVQAGETITFLVTLEGVDTGGAPVDLHFRLVGDGGVVLATRTVTYAPGP